MQDTRVLSTKVKKALLPTVKQPTRTKRGISCYRNQQLWKPNLIKSGGCCNLDGLLHPSALPGKQGPSAKTLKPGARLPKWTWWILGCPPKGNGHGVCVGWRAQATADNERTCFACSVLLLHCHFLVVNWVFVCISMEKEIFKTLKWKESWMHTGNY